MPEAAFSFTIPSIHDNTALDCRVYLPSHSPNAHGLSRHGGIVGAIVAHPYAPVGGCYDDPVVLMVVEELLRQGCFAGTFNFRGVYGGNGHTSWTGKPEIQDYISFAGFFAHYLDLTQRTASPRPMKQLSPSKLHPASANGIASTPTHDANSELKLILGGYSYGSIIVSRLPPLREILYTFRNMQDNIAIAEILQRARTISQWTHEKLDSVRQANGTPPRQSRKHSPSVTIGGDEIQTDHGRISREGGRRSIDLEGLRKSLDIPKRIKEHKRQTQSWGQRSSSVEPEKPDNGNWPSPKPHYLLLSPVLGLVGSALSAFDSSSGAEDVKDTLAKEPTLVIYADKDVFTSTKKVRQWTQTISSRSEDFRAVEVNGAGHFWREPGVIRKLRSALGVWVQELQIESR